MNERPTKAGGSDAEDVADETSIHGQWLIQYSASYRCQEVYVDMGGITCMKYQSMRQPEISMLSENPGICHCSCCSRGMEVSRAHQAPVQAMRGLQKLVIVSVHPAEASNRKLGWGAADLKCWKFRSA